MRSSPETQTCRPSSRLQLRHRLHRHQRLLLPQRLPEQPKRSHSVPVQTTSQPEPSSLMQAKLIRWKQVLHRPNLKRCWPRQGQSPLEAMGLHLLREAVPGAEVCH